MKIYIPEGLATFGKKKKKDNENKDIWCVGNNMDLQKDMRHERKLLDNKMDRRKIKTHSNVC